MQFTWKAGQQLEAPLLQAAERLRHNEGGKGGGREGERSGGVGKRKRKSVEPEVRGHHRKKEEQKTHGMYMIQFSISLCAVAVCILP